MSTNAVAWAWAQQDLDPAQKLTLLALAEGANHQHQCWPTKAVMHALTGLGETAAADCLRALDSRGLLRRETQEGKPSIVFLAVGEAPAVTQAPRREVVAFTPSAGTAAEIEEAICLWNEMAKRTEQGNAKHRISKVVKLNDANRKKLAARLKEFGLDGIAHCIRVIEHSAHCRGVNGWKADITYLLQPAGSGKLRNSGYRADYEEVTNGGQRTGPGGRGDQRLDSIRGFDRTIRAHAAGGDGRQGSGEGDREDAAADGGGAGNPQHRLSFSPADEQG